MDCGWLWSMKNWSLTNRNFYIITLSSVLAKVQGNSLDYILLKTRMGNENRWPIELLQRFGVYTFFRELVKPWRPSIAHWRGSCDQDANTRTKQTSRGNGNWLSPLNSLPSSNITPHICSHSSHIWSHAPILFSHTPHAFHNTFTWPTHTLFLQKKKNSHHTLHSH